MRKFHHSQYNCHSRSTRTRKRTTIAGVLFASWMLNATIVLAFQPGGVEIGEFTVFVRGDFDDDGLFENQWATIDLKVSSIPNDTGYGTAVYYPTGTGVKANCNGEKYAYAVVGIDPGWRGVVGGPLAPGVPDFSGKEVDVTHVERYYDWKYAGYEKLSGVDFSRNCHGFAFGVGDWPDEATEILDVGPFIPGSGKVPCFEKASKAEASIASYPPKHSIKVNGEECEQQQDPSLPVPHPGPVMVSGIVETIEKFRGSGVYRQTSTCPDFVDVKKAKGHDALTLEFYKKK